jgi:E3 ubiquitin-protein ligase HERC4
VRPPHISEEGRWSEQILFFEQKIIIQSTNGGDAYYPVAHTCFNLLDLPKYTDENILKERLLLAIQHKQGFTLV